MVVLHSDRSLSTRLARLPWALRESVDTTLGCSKVGAMMGHGRDWCGYLSVIEPDRALLGCSQLAKSLIMWGWSHEDLKLLASIRRPLVGIQPDHIHYPTSFLPAGASWGQKAGGLRWPNQARFPQEGRRMRQGYQGPQDCSGVWRRAKPFGEVVIVCCSREAGRP